MRKGEFFHGLRVPEGMWFVVRLDGRGFTKLTAAMDYKKPFDEDFDRHMFHTTSEALKEFQGVFATTHSDEISMLFLPTADLFDREVEKIVSVLAGFASSLFTLGINATRSDYTIAGFDGRIWIGANLFDVVDYFSWRCEDASRGAINSYAYWYLRQQKGWSQRRATRELLHKNFAWKNEMLFSEFGLNYNDVPAWQRRGSGLYWRLAQKVGYNPKAQVEVETQRRHLSAERDLPMREQFRLWLVTNLGHIIGYPELRGTFRQTVKEWQSMEELHKNET